MRTDNYKLVGCSAIILSLRNRKTRKMAEMEDVARALMTIVRFERSAMKRFRRRPISTRWRNRLRFRFFVFLFAQTFHTFEARIRRRSDGQEVGRFRHRNFSFESGYNNEPLCARVCGDHGNRERVAHIRRPKSPCVRCGRLRHAFTSVPGTLPSFSAAAAPRTRRGRNEIGGNAKSHVTLGFRRTECDIRPTARFSPDITDAIRSPICLYLLRLLFTTV